MVLVKRYLRTIKQLLLLHENKSYIKCKIFSFEGLYAEKSSREKLFLNIASNISALAFKANPSKSLEILAASL